MKDGKFVKEKDIPEYVLQALIDDKPVRLCVICGDVARGQRYFNQQSLDSCQEHLNNNLGKFAELLRNSNAQSR